MLLLRLPPLLTLVLLLPPLPLLLFPCFLLLLLLKLSKAVYSKRYKTSSTEALINFILFEYWIFARMSEMAWWGEKFQIICNSISYFYLTVLFASTLQWSGVLLLLLLPLLLLLLLLSLRNIMVPRPRTFLPPSRLSPDFW